MSTKTDSFWLSALWGRLGAFIWIILSMVMGYFGYTVSEEDQRVGYELVSAIFGAIGGILVLWSKVRSTKRAKNEGGFSSVSIMTFLTGVFLITLLAIPLFAASIKVTWNPNTEDDLAGYKIYYGTASGVYGDPIDVGNVTNGIIPDVADKTVYYVAVTAYDTSGNESGFSQEVSVDIPDVTAPAAPTNIILEIIQRVLSWIKSWFHLGVETVVV